jgi:mannosylfructose-phosphate synthase
MVLKMQLKDSPRYKSFQSSARPHVLMITNHGIHEWQVIPGLPDTGGQNVFVNHFSQALADEGFRITIANRGGYPHPRTGKMQSGLHFKDDHQRLIYLADGLDQFVRKEDMRERIPELVKSLKTYIEEDGSEVDLIISHYWDAALLAEGYCQLIDNRVEHIWVPHSLGAIKKRNVSKDHWIDLRIDERILVEENLVRKLTAITATSPAIRESLIQDYQYAGMIPFLPPCVDPARFYPREVAEEDPVWEFLSSRAGISPDEIRDSQVIIEISRRIERNEKMC